MNVSTVKSAVMPDTDLLVFAIVFMLETGTAASYARLSSMERLRFDVVCCRLLVRILLAELSKTYLPVIRNGKALGHHRTGL